MRVGIPETFILKNNKIVTLDNTVAVYLVIKGEKISKITESLSNEEVSGETIDLADNLVISEFMDLHIHGARGHDRTERCIRNGIIFGREQHYLLFCNYKYGR